jgi:hypothetical protein
MSLLSVVVASGSKGGHHPSAMEDDADVAARDWPRRMYTQRTRTVLRNVCPMSIGLITE